jgi:hypothetical protein
MRLIFHGIDAERSIYNRIQQVLRSACMFGSKFSITLFPDSAITA